MGLFTRLKRKKIAPTKKASGKKHNGGAAFRGVQLNANNPDCCGAVRAVNGRRFLSDEVPMLPLEDCDSDDCRCTYELYEDRRTGARRKADVEFDPAGRVRIDDQRSSKSSGRRSDD